MYLYKSQLFSNLLWQALPCDCLNSPIIELVDFVNVENLDCAEMVEKLIKFHCKYGLVCFRYLNILVYRVNVFFI